MRAIVPRSVGPWLAVVTLTAAGAAAAVGYGLTAPKRYRATAQLLVAPVSVSDPTFLGLDVLRDTGGKRSAAATAAALLRSPQVADAVRAQLGLARSRDSLLGALDAHVVDSSDIVAVTVADTSAAGSAQLANAFGDALVKQRTAGFQSQLAATIHRDQQLLDGMTPAHRAGVEGTALEQRLTSLHGFEGQPDPTIRHAAQASAPSSASWPKLPRLAAIGALLGLAGGILVALLLVLARLGRARTLLPRDRGVSERLAERLEERVVERIAALEAERERLSAREAGLAARERDVEQKLAELRDAVPAAADTSELEEREAKLGARVQALTQRERGLARLSAELAARERALEARAEELEVAPAEPEPVPEPEPEPVPEPAPALVAVAEAEPAAAAQGGGWNLMVLEKLVNDRGEEFPERVEEWFSYLYFLREYAEPDGSVPTSFDYLIQDTFAELVA